MDKIELEKELSRIYHWNTSLPPINPSGKEIRGVKPTINKTHYIYDFEDPIDFLDVFDINKSELYQEGNDDIYVDYIYRGHTDSSWLLQPSWFRDIQDKKHTYLTGNGHFTGEFDAFVHFVKGMDNINLDISKESYDLIRLINEKEKITSINSNIANECFLFPRDTQLKELALAQHYGVKTRLLDFTENPMIALFFATESLYPFKHLDKENKIGLWVIPKMLIDVIKYVRFLKYVDVKKYQNKYITAQRGVFLHYFPSTVEAKTISDNVEVDNLLDISYTLDNLLTATYENKYLDDLVKEHIGKPMLFTLPEKELIPIAKRLNQLDINWITMMPSLDGVKKEVERQNKKPFSNIL